MVTNGNLPLSDCFNLISKEIYEITWVYIKIFVIKIDFKLIYENLRANRYKQFWKKYCFAGKLLPNFRRFLWLCYDVSLA